MGDSGDYFGSAPVSITPLSVVGSRPAQVEPSSPRRHRRRIVLVPVAVVAVGVGLLATVGLPGSARPTLDRRPIVVPQSIGGLPLKTDDVAHRHAESMVPILKKIFGSNASASAEYWVGDVDLLTGRGPIDHASTGDVHHAAPQRFQFGDITCAHMHYQKVVLTTVSVCWYSSPTFGASLLATEVAMPTMRAVAAALDAAVPGMRGDAG